MKLLVLAVVVALAAVQVSGSRLPVAAEQMCAATPAFTDCEIKAKFVLNEYQNPGRLTESLKRNCWNSSSDTYCGCGDLAWAECSVDVLACASVCIDTWGLECIQCLSKLTDCQDCACYYCCEYEGPSKACNTICPSEY
eukprot:c54665_g1_i1.p2 GENE.c54665_g1_i1~~c54665_g1_i1.p2  ORF type:complete len:152 (-),score=32.06 c54665_g1_i1:68-484(-)